MSQMLQRLQDEHGWRPRTRKSGPDPWRQPLILLVLLLVWLVVVRILLDLNYLKGEVVRCFPERYNVMDVFRSKYEKHLVEQIGALYQASYTQQRPQHYFTPALARCHREGQSAEALVLWGLVCTWCMLTARHARAGPRRAAAADGVARLLQPAGEQQRRHHHHHPVTAATGLELMVASTCSCGCGRVQIVQLGAAKPCSEFETALSVCLQEYLVRVRTQARLLASK